MDMITFPVSRRAFSLLSLGLLTALTGGCRGTLELTPSDAATVLADQAIEGPSPATTGPYSVLTAYYGRGDDKHRPEYRDSVSLITPSVDATKLVDLGSSADSREKYWGFTPDSFPLNGRVWYPDGDGPFPLVLVAHGNHSMEDYSDPGYDYLGEHLASRGFILASLDMNFVNGGIRGENDARGWLFLKHLEQWREFNAGADSPFLGKVDLDRVSLMGHSRGGEAVAHGAAFNSLDYYPDDASLTFDFGFGIRSIVAIAPVDGQYLPSGQGVPLTDVSYLVFHGSHDGDVTSFHGLRQYNRVSFDQNPEGFKAAVYVYRANHGQWNTVWGSKDNGPRSQRNLDLSVLLDPEDQREFALVYVTSFLEATLRDDPTFLPLFSDHRVAGDWLPPTLYVTRYQHGSFRSLATFDEDIDLTTGTADDVTLFGDSLSMWRENLMELRSRNRANTSASQESQALWLGWNRAVKGAPDGELGRPGTYTLDLGSTLAGDWGLDGRTTLDFALGATDRTPGPRDGPEKEEGTDRAAADRDEPNEDDDEAEEPIDLSIEVVDSEGRTARLPLSRYGPVRRPLKMQVLRRNDLEAQRFPQQYEMVLQGYAIPLSDFADATQGLNPTTLRTVRFVFDLSEAGEVVVDDLGFSWPDPGFYSARVSGPELR